MQAADIHHLEFVLLFVMTLVVALSVLARRIQIPYPIMLVVGGLAVSLLPNVPRVELNPDIVFLVLLPPLLFAAAFHMSWPNFRENLFKISMMAFGLVGFTVAAVAYLTSRFLPGIDHRIGFVLGALVASTDAIAASAIAKRMHLLQGIADLLEGESLLNDAASLVALEFSIGMLVSNSVPTVTEGTLRLLYLSGGGILLGLLAGWLIRWCQMRLTDAPIEITLTLLAPYVAYIAAESVHSSGVLATVVCGLYLGARQSESLSARARIESVAIWNTLDFILNGIVFTLIGLQLPKVLEAIRGVRFVELFFDAAFLIALLVALRLTWVFAESWIEFGVHLLFKRPASRPRSNENFFIGWTGMRGVITLAAAMALPEYVDSGAPFPQRDILIFLTFSVILVTLVAQGLSLPWIIRNLGLVAPPRPETQASVRPLRGAVVPVSKVI
jgi:CPA1 family monovalent cation:H+ antiporter